MTKTRQIAAIASVLALLLMAPPGSAQADSDGPLPGPIDNPVNMHCTLPPAPALADEGEGVTTLRSVLPPASLIRCSSTRSSGPV